jgi:hypothetical protein
VDGAFVINRRTLGYQIWRRDVSGYFDIDNVFVDVHKG